MNKHLTASEFQIHSEVFASDVIRAETRKNELRKTLLVCLATSVLVIGAVSLVYEGLVSLKDAMTEHVHYVEFTDSPAGVQIQHFPFMPASAVNATSDISAAQSRIAEAQTDIHQTMSRFQSEQEAFLRQGGTGQLGTILFPRPVQDFASIPLASRQ
jgi:hypothetical protein